MKINTLFFLLFSFATLNTNCFGQSDFTGNLKYKVSMLDTALHKLINDREMNVYTNDTLSRMEILNDALGQQVSIKHMSLNKSYLLMNFMGKKLAIQTSAQSDSAKHEPYEIKYKTFGRKKVSGEVLKKAIVYRDDLLEKRTVWYFKNIRPDLMDYYPGIKGLPADFYIGTVDGILHYTILSIEKMPVPKDLFGIPSDFEKITLSEFLDEVKQLNN